MNLAGYLSTQWLWDYVNLMWFPIVETWKLLPLISSTSVLYIPMILDTCTTVVYGVWLPFIYIPNQGTTIVMTVFIFIFISVPYTLPQFSIQYLIRCNDGCYATLRPINAIVGVLDRIYNDQHHASSRSRSDCSVRYPRLMPLQI